MLRTVLVGGPAHGTTAEVQDGESHIFVLGKHDRTEHYHRRTYWPGIPFTFVDVFLYSEGLYSQEYRADDALRYLWQ